MEKRGYKEVVTSALNEAPGSDPEIEPITADFVPLMEQGPGPGKFHLHTSPEFEMKRLICKGETDIYQICKVFRQGEMGPLHSPEFTMAEYYRLGASYLEMMDELERLIEEAVGGKAVVKGREISLEPPLPRITIAGAMKDAGVDTSVWKDLTESKWREAFQKAWVEKLDPWLADRGALFIVDFPAKLAVLSKLKDKDPAVAERFELLVAGIELANGCSELTDPAEHRRRFDLDRRIRLESGREPFPLPESFLADLETNGLPECAGVALGVERLAMAATGADRIEQVMAAPLGA